MTDNRTMILEEENHSFALNHNIRVKGEVVLENRQEQMMLRVSLKNLRPLKKSYTYQMMILGKKEGRSLYRLLGEIPVNGAGNGAAGFLLDAENVDGRGSSLDCFFIFMVAAVPEQNSREPFHVVLKGEMRQQKERKKRTFNTFYMTYVQERIKLLEKGSMPQIKPFQQGEEVIWHRNPYPEELPVSSVGACQLIKKYGHFIYCFTGEYCVVGVPGRQLPQDQPDGGASGFTRWEPIRQSDEYGYWMAVIERNTGIITEIS